MKIRDEKTKQLFIKYLEKHPDERFMQAVRNFTRQYLRDDVTHIEAANLNDNDYGRCEDTFYWECDALLIRKKNEIVLEEDDEKPAEPKRYRLLKDLPTFKAGEVFVLENAVEQQGLFREADGIMAYHRKTLDKFPNILEEWFEEIKPVGPLIKDEKVRKAVRAWAEANDMNSDSTVVCGKFDDGFETDNSGIEFDCTIRDVLSGVKRGEFYTIAELCGEEE